MEQLHESYAALDHAPRQKAVGGELAAHFFIDAVSLNGSGRLLAKVQELWSRRLHAEGQLVGSNSRRNLVVARFEVLFWVVVPHHVQSVSLGLRGNAGGIGKIQH